jgi:sulfide:quinone oxidoreductase
MPPGPIKCAGAPQKIAYLAADWWRRQGSLNNIRRIGLSTALVEVLAEAALDRGVHAFSATYRAENRPVAALHNLADSTGRQLIRCGIAEFDVGLDRDQVIAAIHHLDEEPET